MTTPIHNTDDERQRIIAHLEIEALRIVPEFSWKHQDPDTLVSRVILKYGEELTRTILSEITESHAPACKCGDCGFVKGVPNRTSIPRNKRVRTKNPKVVVIAPFVPILTKQQDPTPFEKRKFNPDEVRNRMADDKS